MPKSINSLISLVTLDLCGCIKLENLPLLGNISASSKSVELFNDEGFSNLNTIPDAIGELRHLERLSLEGNNFVSLPSSGGGFAVYSIFKLGTLQSASI
ncbi:unnamed protein product [Vicia faba]|uniref:Uncharacterized protein n=1 Tax=Vicia faba TaxID=3906 RepID=A0AAV0Z7Z1_VICFA|nr:unnamed protein product [Vicia faba]